ncbi:cytochrome c oxidase assembly factor Coa1 family protein [Chitiniphilus shinanonensis]|uniref:cytochrome c oxidase assembly factor Coa1 family protein n=1 Tax=Chitiniphilus shinanonensis TaxID=553088 RepID=UPI00306B8103
MDNTSGQGPHAAVPPEIDRWNWGAFLLNWIWGLGNNTPLALLMFVPFVNLVMPFVLGVKGSAWAWRHKRWDSIEAFRATQRRWAWWGLGVLLATVIVVGSSIALMVWSISAAFAQTDAYRLGVARVTSHPAAVSALGQPIVAAKPSGSFVSSDEAGSAEFTFEVRGSKQRGVVYLEASRVGRHWVLDHIELDLDQTGERIDLDRVEL